MIHPGGRTVSRHCQKMEEWVVPQWLGWSSHSLAYEFTQLAKTSHTALQKLATKHFMATAPAFCYGPNPAECASLWIWTNPPLTYRCVANWIFAMRHQSLSFIRSWSESSRFLDGLKSWERGAGGREEKAVGKIWIPFITSLKIC